MNNIKPLAIIAVLASCGFGLRAIINNQPESIPPAEAGPMPSAPPLIEMGDPGSPLASLGTPTPLSGATNDPSQSAAPAASEGGTAAPFVPPASASTAPAFDPQAQSPTATVSPADTLGSANESSSDAAESSAPAGDYSAVPEYTTSNQPPTADRYAAESAFAPEATPGEPASRAGFPPAQHATFSDAWNAAQNSLRENDLDAALLTLTPWYHHSTLGVEEDQELTQLLGQLAGTVVYSRGFHLEPEYVASAAGEPLDDVARQYNVPVALLARINGLSETARLTEGQTVKVLRGPFSGVVDATNGELVLLLDGRYAGRFDIGVGQERQDIEGQFTVNTKLLNPPYFGPDKTIDPGSPENPLGGHWIGLTNAAGADAAPFGIHGTNDPASLSSDPRGFIRLAPQDAEHAFYILGRGSSVTIRR